MKLHVMYTCKQSPVHQNNCDSSSGLMMKILHSYWTELGNYIDYNPVLVAGLIVAG